MSSIETVLEEKVAVLLRSNQMLISKLDMLISDTRLIVDGTNSSLAAIDKRLEDARRASTSSTSKAARAGDAKPG